MVNALPLCLSLLLVFLQMPPFGPLAPQKPEAEKPKSPVKGWEEIKAFGVPANRISMPQKGIIQVESLGSRSSLFRKVEEKEKSLPRLAWRWKVSGVVRSAIETRKDRHDAAARVMAVFGVEGGFKLFGDGEPRGKKIEYIWATTLAQGKLFDHPGERDCRIFVLETGEKKAGQWVSEERDIRKDFRTAYGEDPPPLLAIGIETDTDHSNESVNAWYSEPVLKK
jgi:hypothetical protein